MLDNSEFIKGQLLAAFDLTALEAEKVVQGYTPQELAQLPANVQQWAILQTALIGLQCGSLDVAGVAIKICLVRGVMPDDPMEYVRSLRLAS